MPPGLQHSMDLGDRRLDVGRVVENPEGVHGVEGRVVELEALGVAQPEVDLDVSVRRVVLRDG